MQSFETVLTGLAPEVNSISIIINMPQDGDEQVSGSIWDRTTYQDREPAREDRFTSFALDIETNRDYVEAEVTRAGWTIGEWQTYLVTISGAESDVLTATR